MIQELKPIFKFTKGFLRSRKLIFSFLFIAVILAVFTILLNEKEYVSNTSFIVQTGGERSAGSGLKNIADLIGVNLGSKKETGDIPVYLYPKLVNSLSYNRKVLNSEIRVRNRDSLISVKNYYKTNYKPPALSKVKKYTIGLPGLIKRAIFKKKKEDIVLFDLDSIEYISREEASLIDLLQKNVMLSTDKEDGTIYITVRSKKPEIAAQIARIAREKLQEKIIEYRIAKVKEGFEFIDQEYQIKRKEYLESQDVLANYIDRNRFNNTERSLLQRRQLENKVSLRYAVYSELESQRISAQISLKEDTPVFATLNPAFIPLEPENGSALFTLLKFVFTGFLVALFVYSYRNYMYILKKQWHEA